MFMMNFTITKKANRIFKGLLLLILVIILLTVSLHFVLLKRHSNAFKDGNAGNRVINKEDEYGSTEDGWIYYCEKKGEAVICGVEGNDKILKIPKEVDGNKVVGINNFAFAYNEFVMEITVPDTVTRIEEYVFCDCNQLEFVYVPSSVKCIKEKSFADTGKKFFIKTTKGSYADSWAKQNGINVKY